MANIYDIGQHRFTENTNYITQGSSCNGASNAANGGKIELKNPLDASSGTTSGFRDVWLTVLDNTSTTPSPLSTSSDYCLHLEIPKSAYYSYDLDVILVADGATSTNNAQYLRKIHVDRGTWQNVTSYDVALYQKEDGEITADIINPYTSDQSVPKIYPYWTHEDPTNSSAAIQYANDKQTQLFNYVSLGKTWGSSNASSESSVGFVTFDIVFRPILSGKNRIVLQMYRGIDDYKIRTQSSNAVYTGRVLDIASLKYSITTMKNLCGSSTTTYAMPSPLTRIGVWSHPGFLMAINGEEIRVGQSGYYELDAVPITSLSVFAKDFANDNFSIDYQYVSSS